MKGFVRRLFALVAAMLALAPTFMAQAPTPAEAAAKVYVDDNPANNNSTTCPTSGTYLTIQEGVDNAPDGGTVYVCEGVYTAGASISGRNNLKVLAKGNVQINPPAGYTGNVFHASSSTKITIQGFVFNGKSNLGSGGIARAVYFYASSGLIKNNYILNWREPDPGTAVMAHQAIMIFNPASSGTVTIDHNTLYDYQGYGIQVSKQNKVKVSHNQLVFTSGGAVQPYGIVAGATTNGTISANTIRSNYGLYDATSTGYGIDLQDTTSMKVTANTITNVRYGVSLVGFCSGDMRKNTISGNKINEAQYSVRLFANGVCSYPFADNVVSGNKIYVNSFPPASGRGINLTAGGGALITGTVVKGNTLAGFGYVDPIYISAGVTGTVMSGNKVKFMPPPGL